MSTTKPRSAKLAVLGLAVGAASCGSDASHDAASSRGSEAPAGAVVEADPEALFFGLEDRLTSAQYVHVDFAVKAEGAIEVDLAGGFDLGPGETLHLSADGHFNNEPADLRLWSDGSTLQATNGVESTSEPTPAALGEAVVVGFTRMGILHNLARLTGATAPDHAAGGIREWVTVEGFSRDGESPAAAAFELTVAAQPAGSATLEFDPEGLPVARYQTVRFPNGEMRVEERYTTVVVRDR